MALKPETESRLNQGQWTKEFLVGLLALLALALMAVFAWLMGVLGPVSAKAQYKVLYDFAGGVEVGSPVRVSGVKVGRVEDIRFLEKPTPEGMLPASLEITLTVSRRALGAVREDSNFYINMAGIIGERYVEISPGSGDPLKDGARVRGVDPPRVDQLLSQGYGAFGKVQEFLEKNNKTISEFLDTFNNLMKDANRILKESDPTQIQKLLNNMVVLTTDMTKFTKDLSDEKATRFFQQLGVILERAHAIDRKVLEDFLQEEGIRARIF